MSLSKISFKYYIVLCFQFSYFAIAQNPLSDFEIDSILHHFSQEIYISTISDSKQDINQLGENFSIDRVVYDSNTQKYQITLWCNKNDFKRFIQNHKTIYKPFNHTPSRQKKSIHMAYSLSDFLVWNKYPTYSVYLDFLNYCQTQYADLCHIDTILKSTPDNHQILALKISNNINIPTTKPEVFLSANIHGDENVSFYCMLRLIHYLISTYQSNEFTQNLLNNTIIYICPNLNPDGTYRTSNNMVGESPTSTRSNSNNTDLNRNFPNPKTGNETSYEPETQALMDYAFQHCFTMSACFHAGSELVNYPWDSYLSYVKKHADNDWFSSISRKYANYCQQNATDGYFTDENNGITNGGDWYVVYGSLQDFMCYFNHCKELTIEISHIKTPENVDDYWNYNREAILHLIEECHYGLKGLIRDSLTQEPIIAKIFLNNYDQDNSDIYNGTPFGDYYRPLLNGNYNITFSANGYISKTISTSIINNTTPSLNVDLVRQPLFITENKTLEECKIFPNPAFNQLHIAHIPPIQSIEIHNISGNIIQKDFFYNNDDDNYLINIETLSKGIYFIYILTPQKQYYKKFIKL